MDPSDLDVPKTGSGDKGNKDKEEHEDEEEDEDDKTKGTYKEPQSHTQTQIDRANYVYNPHGHGIILKKSGIHKS